MEVKEAPASAEAASFPTEIENREDTDKEKSEVGQSKQRGRPRKRNHSVLHTEDDHSMSDVDY